MKHLEHLANRFVNWSAIYKHNTAKEVLDEVLGDLVLIKDSMEAGEPIEEITKAYSNCFMRLFDSAQRAGISPEMIRESFMTPSDHEEERKLKELYMAGAGAGSYNIEPARMGSIHSVSGSSSYEDKKEEKKKDDSYQYIPSYVPDSSSYYSHDSGSSSHDHGSFGGGDSGGGGANGDW